MGELKWRFFFKSINNLFISNAIFVATLIFRFIFPLITLFYKRKIPRRWRKKRRRRHCRSKTFIDIFRKQCIQLNCIAIGRWWLGQLFLLTGSHVQHGRTWLVTQWANQQTEIEFSTPWPVMMVMQEFSSSCRWLEIGLQAEPEQ